MNLVEQSKKFAIQNEQYGFPYHYIPHFDSLGYAQRYRRLSRGLEYVCYVKHVVDRVQSM